jgi:hypothetical protein
MEGILSQQIDKLKKVQAKKKATNGRTSNRAPSTSKNSTRKQPVCHSRMSQE